MKTDHIPEPRQMVPAVGARAEREVRRPRSEAASLTATLLRAAQLLDEDAASLKACHTLRGQWKGEEDAKALHDEMRRVSKELRKARKYMQRNPLGGPANVFDACADSIRAGDAVEFAMANFGLAWTPND